MSGVIGWIEAAVLVYFTVLNTVYALSVYIAGRQLERHVRRRHSIGLSELIGRDFYKPVSLLVPAYNEEETIESSVNSFLGLSYPEFEVIVINDGSRDETINVLIRAFELTPTERSPSAPLETKAVRGLYRSRRWPNLLVIDKANGGKADALNAGLSYAVSPLFCAVDADSILDAQALLRLARRFIEDDQVVAAGGSVRIINGSRADRGKVRELRLPGGWVERFQIVEYARAFLSGRATFSALGVLLIISGAFGLFKRQEAVRAGGFLEGTVGEDMEMIVRLHRHMRETGQPYRIEFDLDPVCWTQCPDTLEVLGNQRDRWQRGLIEALWRHRKMWFNPRYGRIGVAAIPWYLLFEALAPVIELGGYLMMLLSALLGSFDLQFAALFALLALLYGTVVSVSALSIELFMEVHFTRRRDRVLLMLTALAENFGYRQWHAWVRVRGMLKLGRKKGQWGAMTRKKL